MRNLAILRLPEVKKRTGLSRSTIYEKIRNGAFPEQVNLAPRAVGWIESEIEGWLCTQVENSRSRAVDGRTELATEDGS